MQARNPSVVTVPRGNENRRDVESDREKEVAAVAAVLVTGLSNAVRSKLCGGGEAATIVRARFLWGRTSRTTALEKIARKSPRKPPKKQ